MAETDERDELSRHEEANNHHATDTTTICSKVKNFWQNITIEPSVFLVTFGYSLYSVIAQVRVDIPS